MTKPRELSEEEMREIIEAIAKPTFKYMMKRVNNSIISKPENYNLSLNSFISAIVSSMASIDANLLKWIEAFYKAKVGKDIDSYKLRLTLARNLNEQFGIKMH